MEDQRPNKDKKSRQPLNRYLKYSNIGLQMLIIIAAGVFGGQWLDAHFELKAPVFTVVLSLLAVCAAIYLVIRMVLNDD